MRRNLVLLFLLASLCERSLAHADTGNGEQPRGGGAGSGGGEVFVNEVEVAEESPRILHRLFQETDTTLNATFTTGLGRIATESLKALGITLAFVVVIALDWCCIPYSKGNSQATAGAGLSLMRQPLLEDLEYNEMIELGVAPNASSGGTPGVVPTAGSPPVTAASTVKVKTEPPVPPPPQPQPQPKHDEIDDLFI